MLKLFPRGPINNVAILAAALLLQQLHGTEFAARFLQQHGFDDSVITELLGSSTGNSR